jgi:hypothetical protein
MTDDLKLAYDALSTKQTAYNQLFDYYDGKQPLVYSTKRLREVFNRINARFSENWCAVVVDSVLERINLARWTVAQSDAATEILNDLWTSTEMHLDSDDAHLAALVCGEAFVIAWREAEGGTVQAYYNDPRLCHVFYDPENPREKRMATKWWTGEDERRYLTLYYPDRLEYYASAGKASDVSSAAAFKATEEPKPNPFGVVPVFHLRRERRAVRSELGNVIEPQNAINKLLADMMVAAEFGAFKQRYIISQSEPGIFKNAPNEIWMIPAGTGEGQGTSAGEFSATDLEGYLKAIDNLATKLAVITRTPKHYLLQQGGDPSGEALIAMEAPLVRKCNRYIERFTVPWRQVAAFMLALAGQAVSVADITPIFDPVPTVQPKTQAEIRKTSVEAGMPLQTVLRQSEGWTEAELAEMEADRQAEAAAQQETLASAMLEAQRRFDQGPQGGER